MKIPEQNINLLKIIERKFLIKQKPESRETKEVIRIIPVSYEEMFVLGNMMKSLDDLV